MFDTLTDSFKNAIGKIRFHDDEKALKKATAELKKSQQVLTGMSTQ
jgi:signal recognition particle subunit SRP54